MNNSLECFGLTFKGIKLDRILNTSNFIHVVTVNSEYIVKANTDYPRLKKIINNNLATLDGQIPFFIAKQQNKGIDVEKISGSDFIYDYSEYAKENSKRLLLIGGQLESNKVAVQKLIETYNIEVQGISPMFEDYPFSSEFNNMIHNSIKEFKPHAVFVGFGAIKQDFWIDDNRSFLANCGVEIAIGCGGTIDFVAGKQKRAPKVIQKIGLEGVYRFCQEPKLFRLKRLLLSLNVLRFI